MFKVIGQHDENTIEQAKRVLTYHQDSVKIEHRLTPCIVLMAGANDFDPYKD